MLIVRIDATITEKHQSLLSYAEAFEEGYVVRLIVVRTMNIDESMIFWNILTSNSGTTYMRYITADNIMRKHQGVLNFLLTLGRDAPVTKKNIVHFNDPGRYISTEEDILQIIKDTDRFAKIDNKLPDSS